MKRKYLLKLKRFFILCLSFFISVGSFAMLFAVQASAYDVTGTGQLKITNGVCYNGRDPNHPFIYTTEPMGINDNTYVPSYKRGNDGAGGNIGGTSEILMTRINTGEAWSSVPLYRVSRSGGYSDDLIQTTSDGVDIVSSWQIQSAVNGLAGINRQVTSSEAEKMQKIYVTGFKAGLETTGSGNNYSWDDNLRYIATKILAWEIQEGKRTGFGYEDYAAPGTNNMVGGVGDWGARYWKGWWDNEVMPRAYSGATNWYYKILEMCQASNELSVTSGNTGVSVNAGKFQPSAPTLNASYLHDGRYELSLFLSNGNLWGNNYGQYNADCVQWIPDPGSRSATLGWNGSTGYLTSGWDNPNQPISGYLKFTQKASTNMFNDVGYMKGGSTNAWRGFLFGGNSTSTPLFVRVGSTGGPSPITVRFVDNDTGQPVNVNWTFKENTTTTGQFTEAGSNKSFVPQYYLDNHNHANYTFTINSVPINYLIPSQPSTGFYYNGSNIYRYGTDPGAAGWGSWDYAAAQASFNGNTVTIALKQKPPTPVTVKFIDGDTGDPVAVDFSAYQKTGLITYSKQFSATNKATHSWTPTYKGDQRIDLDRIPENYTVTQSVYKYSYLYGFPQATTVYTNMRILENGTIEIKLYKKVSSGNVTIEVRDGSTGELMQDESLIWGLANDSGYNTIAISGQVTFRPPATGQYTVTMGGILNDSGGTDPVQNPITKFDYDGTRVSLSAENENPHATAAGQRVVIYLYREGEEISKDVTVQFIDGDTGEPLEVGWAVSTESNGFDSRDEVDEYSTGKRFTPQYYTEYGELMLYWLQLYDIPAGYSWPIRTELIFAYDGKLSEEYGTMTEVDFEEAQAQLSYHNNIITVSLYKTPEPPPVERPDMGLDFIEPNSDYHFGETVISSYYLENNSSTAYNPTSTTLRATLTLEKENGTQLGQTETTGILCPGNATQLLYFKWTVPQLLSSGTEKYQLRTRVYDSIGNLVTESTDKVTIVTKGTTDTPPNKFDTDGGKLFVQVAPLNRNQDYYNSAAWQEYVWANGTYEVKTYKAKLWTEEITVYPDETNPSAALQGTIITSRSGYALKLRLQPKLEQYDGSTLISDNRQVTAAQYAAAYYPEFGYSIKPGEYSTLELTETGFAFPVYADSTYQDGAQGDGRKHFVPMWYPDGNYTVQCKTSGCWTPAGMLTYTDEANPVTIKGSLYDDWYSSGKDK